MELIVRQRLGKHKQFADALLPAKISSISDLVISLFAFRNVVSFDVYVGREDVGMGVERGNILQYCYTVEDKYGNESNPSPISTIESLCEKYPDADSPLGYKYYYKSVVVTGFSLTGYTAEQVKNLEKFNLYRRDVEYNSGTIYSQFVLVKQANIDSSSAIDSQADSLRDISYSNASSPASTSITFMLLV